MQPFNDVHPTTREEQHHDHRLYTMASNDAQVQAKNYPLRNDYPEQASSVSSLRCMDTLKSKGLEAPAPQASRGPKRQRPWKIKHAGEGVNDGPDSDFGTYPVQDLGAVIERGRQKGLHPLPRGGFNNVALIDSSTEDVSYDGDKGLVPLRQDGYCSGNSSDHEDTSNDEYGNDKTDDDTSHLPSFAALSSNQYHVPPPPIDISNPNPVFKEESLRNTSDDLVAQFPDL